MSITRREFLTLGRSLAMAGVAACVRQPRERIVPYVRQPEDLIPGRPRYYATAMPLGGFALGLLVESHMGRPTKVEGNPEHPASLGATDVFAQAAVLDLYDPARSQALRRSGQIAPFGAFSADLARALAPLRARRGAGLRLLTGRVTSPTLAAQVRTLLDAYPEAHWHRWEPVASDGAHAGARLAFGEDVGTHYRLAEARVIVALDADLLGDEPGAVRHARDFADGRRLVGGRVEMNRLYALECAPTPTGAAADHRLALRPSQVAGFARALARALGLAAAPPGDAGAPAGFVDALARDLRRCAGACAVVAGRGQPAEVHALAHAMNHALGAAGRAVVHTDPVEADPVEHVGSIRALAEELHAGGVDALVILGGNPAHDAPADLDFARALGRARFSAHLALYEDETSARCRWHVPEAHFLESWSDARAFDGTVTILQPLIAPLYGGKSAHELLAALLGRPDRTSHALVRAHWADAWGGDGPAFEERWRRALHDGVVAGTALPPRAVTPHAPAEAARAPEAGLELAFRPDPTVWDGRFAGNAWLQELPKPLTTLTWDNAALISPRTARDLGVVSGDLALLALGDHSVRAPVLVERGHADGAVTVTLGYGRRRVAALARGLGFDAYRLRASDALWSATGLALRPAGGRRPLAVTQEHREMEGRDPVRAAPLARYRAEPEFARARHPEPPPSLSLYPARPPGPHAWAMAIDLSVCTGCNACVIACQAENNIPTVGRRDVLRGREMHWLRVDRYDDGDAIHCQPVPCMHCENAPCELVCPVAATVHNDEGLNQNVYNRCIGTRYCANNCPYKVRRFNYRQYNDEHTESLKALRNPDVTVRSRGVMEKCTYCVQRINAARIQASLDGRPVRDGEVVTACQQACPSRAISFGDLQDAASEVARLRAEPRRYALLADLGTRPRTTYLARVRNPNPEIPS